MAKSLSSDSHSPPYDVIILGAGGAGMMCAIHAGNRGRKVLLIDHAKKIGGKILISGGGRCNFTNTGASPAQYVSENSHFCKSALSRYEPQDFLALIHKHQIAYHEKKLGQLFCDLSAQQVIDLLKLECDEAGAEFLLETQILSLNTVAGTATGTATGTASDTVAGTATGTGAGAAAQAVTGAVAKTTSEKNSGASAKAASTSSDDSSQKNETRAPVRFEVETSTGKFFCESLVVATGGLSIPKMGASGFGYEIAKQFGLSLIERAPALDGFTLGPSDAKNFGDLAGVALDTTTTCNGMRFRENILFTHAGLSGPATLQASLHWRKGSPVVFDLVPLLTDQKTTVFEWLRERKKEKSKALLKNLLGEWIPARLSDRFCELYLPENLHSIPLVQMPERPLQELSDRLHAWTIIPSGTVGYGKAEVTRGGVNTDELSSKTMEAKKIPGLYFIGEVVDVTGWLGGYNFQWAWASGHAAGIVV